MIEHKMSEMKA